MFHCVEGWSGRGVWTHRVAAVGIPDNCFGHLPDQTSAGEASRGDQGNSVAQILNNLS
jgi:hypothetical protein